jgi:hypothetical protein
MALSLIAIDGYFVVVLAAWWRLRRSAYLLPHLRRGPSSFVFHPGHGLVARIMAISIVSAVLSMRGRRLLTGRVVGQNGPPAQTRLLPRAQAPDVAFPPRPGSGLRPGPREGGWSTVPLRVSAGLGPASPSTPPSASPRTPPSTSRAVAPPVSLPIPEPRRPSWALRGTSRGMSGGMSEGSVEPPTCPLPVVGRPSPGPATVPIGRPAEPPHGEQGSGSGEPPTRPARARQPASARRGAA